MEEWEKMYPDRQWVKDAFFVTSGWKFVKKVLEKLGLKKLFYSCCKPFCSVQAIPNMPYVDAVSILEAEYPRKPVSSILSQTSAAWNREHVADLDIVIPCYNVEKYVEGCLSSILQQKTEYSFRLLIVDDGSTDGTGALVDKYNNLPSCFVIHQENRGLSGARNTALEYLQAPYVMFVDSDDTLPPGSIQLMMDAAIKKNCGMVQGGVNTMSMAGEIIEYRSQIQGDFSVYDDLKGYAWGKIFKSSYFKQLRFPEGLWYEDMIVRQLLYPMLIQSGERIYGVNVPAYNYRMNTVGISKTGNKYGKIVDTYWVTIYNYKDRKKLGIPNGVNDLNDVLLNAMESFMRVRFRSHATRVAIFVAYSEFIKREFQGVQPTRHQQLYQAMMESNYSRFRLYSRLMV